MTKWDRVHLPDHTSDEPPACPSCGNTAESSGHGLYSCHDCHIRISVPCAMPHTAGFLVHWPADAEVKLNG